MKRNLLIQIRWLFVISLINFIAQVVYFLHLYYTPQHPFPELRSLVLMGSVFALLLGGYRWFVQGKRWGYFLLALFMALEFLFYLWNIIGGALHGLGPFFHLNDSDPILWLVFAIGYLNFFASGYCLALLLIYRAQLKPPS